MNDSFLTAEVESLIQGYVEGELTASECARLRELLKTTPGLIVAILANLQVDTLIRQAVLQTAGAALKTLPNRNVIESAVMPMAKRFRHFALRLAAAIGFVALVAFGAMFFGLGKKLQPSSTAITPTGTGSILYEVWVGISGSTITDLTSHLDFPNSPTGNELLPDFEAPGDRGQDYGARIRGYLHPQVNGNYRFWIAADDAGELWLSVDENPANKKRICFLNTWSPLREWTWKPSQQSPPIQLEAGRRYYIEALHKQGNAGDHFAVAWQPPGAARGIIPGRALSPFSQTNAGAGSGQPPATP